MKIKKKHNPLVVSTHLNILFHHYRQHKDSLTALRIWSIAKLISPKYCGKVNLHEILNIVKISEYYFLKKILPQSEFFRALAGQTLYLNSYKKINKKHRLGKGVTRKEKMTKKFIGQFASKAKFKGYILKSYVEIDLQRKYKNITKGRISYAMVAKEFKISRRTAINILNNSTAKPLQNIKHFPQIRFKTRKEFGNWLLNNMDKYIDGYRVSDNSYSYRLFDSKNDYYLIQFLPNIYRFTGVCLVGRKKGATFN